MTENTPDKCLITTNVEECIETPFFNTKYNTEYLKAIDESFEKATNTGKEKKTIEGSEIPSFSLGLTQDFDNVVVEENVPTVVKDIQPVVKDDIRPVVSAETINARIPVRHTRARIRENGKRIASASDYVRSPFLVREVDMNMPLTLEEKKIVAYVGLHTGPHL